MIRFFNKYKKSVQKHTDFFDNSFFNAVPDIPLVILNKPHNNQLCTDLSRLISAYPVVSHFLRFAWQTTHCRTDKPINKEADRAETGTVADFGVFLGDKAELCV